MRGVFLGLGSNLGDRTRHLDQALGRLGDRPEITVRRVSPVYETAPVGPAGQGPYLNAAAEIETRLEPAPLLGILLEIERHLGRVRTEHWGARTIDLDLLLYGARRVDQPGLTVPHPRLSERRFVLVPLRDIAAEVVVPGLGRTVGELCDLLPDDGGVKRA